jgi:hypothetical protein
MERRMPRDDIEAFHIAAATASCLVAVGLYRWMGFFGVGLLGLVIVFVAAHADFEDGRGGGGNVYLHASQIAVEERATRGEKAQLRSERAQRKRSTGFALGVGLAFLCVGNAGFLLFQLPMWGDDAPKARALLARMIA